MKICFLGNSVSCMNKKRMRNSTASSICWHSGRFHSLLYNKNYGTKPDGGRKKTFLLCKANFLCNTDRRESSLIRLAYILRKHLLYVWKVARKWNLGITQRTGNDRERLFAEWRLRHDSIFNYKLPRRSTNSFLCCLNWCFGRDVYRRHETRHPVESVKLLFIEIASWAIETDSETDRIGRLIPFPSDGGWDYCVLTGDQVGD